MLEEAFPGYQKATNTAFKKWLLYIKEFALTGKQVL